ncbi:MAG: AmmeMemoRadiSam system protein B [Bacteroidetes bacterium]|nr:AmmeMemoRadiSam system protein B [Bacteroidota bacterium]
MKIINSILIVIMFLIFSQNFCNSQNRNKEDQSLQKRIDRQPAVAGQFYPGNKNNLEKTLEELFSKAKSGISEENTIAILSPHAGYVFSGEVAANSFKQLDPDSKYKTIFILGSSHRTMFSGASIYNIGNYITPLGEVKVDIPLSTNLINGYDIFSFNGNAHLGEHSLEVQLPFLQYWLKNEFSIVPVVLGTQSPRVIEKIARALKPYFTSENLFVISTDFSHYPSHENAVRIDNSIADAVVSNSPAELLNTISKHEKEGIENLATTLCGWTSVLTLMYMTRGDKDISYHKVKYMNSGDTQYGDNSRVVGYWSISVTSKTKGKKETGFSLDKNDKMDLLHIARNTMEFYVNNGKIISIDDEKFSNHLHTPAGAFVSLHSSDGKLRGCIGQFDAKDPLYKVISEMTISASTRDYRFKPVTPEELKGIELEISVLTPKKKIQSIDEITLGKHGIYIVKDGKSGTFLPQVAGEFGWTKEEFLGRCSRDKARIGWEGWKDADIYIFEAIIFSENDLKQWEDK